MGHWQVQNTNFYRRRPINAVLCEAGRDRNAAITCAGVELERVNVRIAAAILTELLGSVRLGDLRLGEFFFGLGI